ncbi:MAG TPA: hypothetical protein VM933_08245 [Acidimicrobiales bacterium]|nr:hypothetical protein [Acidimicrobiales bacterium]
MREQGYQKRTELWSNDPDTGEATLLDTFEHPLSEDDLRAFAIAAALPYIDHLTLEDCWTLGG